jgi:uncharacterized membrane protein YdbT with pleckstrin-like domain
MRYIERILQPGETLVHSSELHWIIYLPAAVLLLVTVSALTQLGDASSGPIWLLVAIACAIFGVIALISAWVRRWTTEIDVTSRRIVYKRGLIRRRTIEMNMDKVESVDVDQSILGRLLNFGDITIRGTGVGLEPLRSIDDPLTFRNHVTAR